LARFEPEVLILGDNYLPSLAVKKPARTTVIWVAHHNYARFRNQPLTEGPCDYDCFLAHRLERRALRKADYAVFASLYMETVFRSTLGAAPPGRVVPNAFVLPNGLTDRREQIRSELRLKGSDILIYLPSGGSSIKGRRYVPALIQRLSRVNPAPTFYVSGHISDDFRWESAQMAPGARIIADGFVSSATNIERVSACDIAVSPALMENYSCALLEAQAMGVPCVTFDVGGNREVVADGLSGFVVSFLDLDTLAMKAAELMAAPLLRSRMSDTARTHAATIADPARLLAAWNGVLSGAHTRQGAI
jgi:glycosyltransferase involved in cell wall biosynthesis